MYKINDDKGFHNIDHDIDSLNLKYGVPEILVQQLREARISQKLMLIVSELGEALEAVRHGNPPDSHIPKFTGLEAESADAVIRIMNLLEGDKKLDLAKAIIAKASYNSRRPKFHGGKKF